MPDTQEGATTGTDTVETSAPVDLDSVMDAVAAEHGTQTLNTEAAGGQVETTSESGTPASDPSTQNVELHTVKVNGEDLQVPYDELVSGYSRQADYTRKTQALAAKEERLAAFEALDQAFANDPQGTLEGLATALGVNLGNQSPEVESNAPDPDDPVARELAELRQWRQEVEADRQARAVAERQAAIDREIETVKTKYQDPNLDEEALLQFAFERKVGDLDAAYRAMKYDPAELARVQEAQAALNAKRTAPPVAGGGNRNVGVVPGSSTRPSLDEAWRLALSEAQ